MASCPREQILGSDEKPRIVGAQCWAPELRDPRWGHRSWGRDSDPGPGPSGGGRGDGAVKVEEAVTLQVLALSQPRGEGFLNFCDLS